MYIASVLHPDKKFSGLCFRGFAVTPEEAKEYENTQGKVIFFRSFASTSTSVDVAEDFASDGVGKNGRTKRVITEIDCSKVKELGIAPLSIKDFSYFSDEDEVLMPLLSGFHVREVVASADEIRLKLDLQTTMSDITAAFIY